MYAQLKNNVVIMDNVHKEDRMTTKTQLLMFYTKVNGCIMWIRLRQTECQWSINDFLSCNSGD